MSRSSKISLMLIVVVAVALASAIYWCWEIRQTPESRREARKEVVKALRDAQGDEVAMAIDGVTVGRQIDVEDVIYVELLESTIKELQKTDLNEDEKMTLQEYLEIKRKQDKFWGM